MEEQNLENIISALEYRRRTLVSMLETPYCDYRNEKLDKLIRMEELLDALAKDY